MVTRPRYKQIKNGPWLNVGGRLQQHFGKLTDTKIVWRRLSGFGMAT
jgi:hypothetical protein